MIKKPAKQKTIKQLEKKLRSILYPLIKQRDGNVCISCGKRGLESFDWQAGHYIKAELCSLKFRYDERNIHSQCSVCNKWRAGNTIEYRKNLIGKYGEELVKELEFGYAQSKKRSTTASRIYLETLIEYYKTVVKLARI
jgi:hypothetical protein